MHEEGLCRVMNESLDSLSMSIWGTEISSDWKTYMEQSVVSLSVKS